MVLFTHTVKKMLLTKTSTLNVRLNERLDLELTLTSSQLFY